MLRNSWRGASMVSALLVTGLLIGCGQDANTPSPAPAPSPPISYGGYGNPSEIRFKDDAQSNSTPKKPLQEMTFFDLDGKGVPLKQFLGQKNLVLVITRGHSGPLGQHGFCPACTTQVSSLINNRAEIAQRNAEVIVVFPVEWGTDVKQFDVVRQAATAAKFQRDADQPFPLLLDLQLQAVKSLEISEALSKPATYILDRKGQVRFAYVGASPIDRPSPKAILKQLDALQGKSE